MNEREAALTNAKIERLMDTIDQQRAEIDRLEEAIARLQALLGLVHTTGELYYQGKESFIRLPYGVWKEAAAVQNEGRSVP